jgi:hypothetical protein
MMLPKRTTKEEMSRMTQVRNQHQVEVTAKKTTKTAVRLHKMRQRWLERYVFTNVCFVVFTFRFTCQGILNSYIHALVSFKIYNLQHINRCMHIQVARFYKYDLVLVFFSVRCRVLNLPLRRLNLFAVLTP